MKKKVIASLALAGALAATMMPAFAANPTTTVGYMAGGNASTDGRIMVTVPKNVTFTTAGEKVPDFDVKAMVWDVAQSTWTEPGTIKMGKEITVSVASANAYKLSNTSAANVEGAYEYQVADPDGVDGIQNAITLNNTNHPNKKEAVEIGTLKDATGNGTGANVEVYKLGGTVTMTTTPNVGQTQNGVYFSDTLTYTFDSLTNP